MNVNGGRGGITFGSNWYPKLVAEAAANTSALLYRGFWEKIPPIDPTQTDLLHPRPNRPDKARKGALLELFLHAVKREDKSNLCDSLQDPCLCGKYRGCTSSFIVIRGIVTGYKCTMLGRSNHKRA